MTSELLAVRDFDRLAILDLHHIAPVRIEYKKFFWAFFPREEASEILDAYEEGRLKVEARDLVASIHRVIGQIRERQLSNERGCEYVS